MQMAKISITTKKRNYTSDKSAPFSFDFNIYSVVIWFYFFWFSAVS